MLSNRWHRFVLGLLVGVALLFSMARFVNLASALDKFNDYAWSQIYIVLALSLIYYLIKALRWHYLLRVLDIRLPLRRSVVMYLAGQWFAITPAGEFVRAYLLMRDGFSFSRGSAVVMVAILFDFLSLAIVGAFSVLWYSELATPVLTLSVVLVAGVLALAYGPAVAKGRRLPVLAGKEMRLGARWRDFFQHSHDLVSWKPLLIGLVFGLSAVLAGSAVLLQVSLGYGIPVSLGQSAHVYSVSQLLGGLSMLPHGLGVIEGTSVALFSYAGIDPVFAASATVLFRLATVGWSVVLGGISLILLRTSLAESARLDA